ncbi:hypothetical protein RF11_10189 [Thelohanellus kitauei]|uniref:Uncharacterized protein n=1 Tax=Thelohanellus kitauei TaxID=669202 RepID=A0A0C2MYH2_THEKT|nr:hypothetical protein RF11_10189 [Thelohanellus kitauei]
MDLDQDNITREIAHFVANKLNTIPDLDIPTEESRIIMAKHLNSRPLTDILINNQKDHTSTEILDDVQKDNSSPSQPVQAIPDDSDHANRIQDDLKTIDNDNEKSWTDSQEDKRDSSLFP